MAHILEEKSLNYLCVALSCSKENIFKAESFFCPLNCLNHRGLLVSQNSLLLLSSMESKLTYLLGKKRRHITLSSSVHLELLQVIFPSSIYREAGPGTSVSYLLILYFACSKRLVCPVTQKETAYKSKLNIS